MSVVIIGSATLDRQVHPDASIRRQYGGVVTYGGLTFGRHGVAATCVCNLPDPYAGPLARLLGGSGVTLACGVSDAITTFVNPVDGDGGGPRELVARARSVSGELIDGRLADDVSVCLGPLHPRDLDSRLVESLVGSGSRVFLDVQGYLRRDAIGHVLPELSDELVAALHAAAVVKAEHEEMARILSGYHLSLAQLVREFALEEVLVTRGADGGVAVTASGEVIEYDAETAGPTLDATGAGDVFFAAYLVHRFWRGAPVRAALRQAATVAAQQVAGRYIEPGELAVPVQEGDSP